MTTRKIVLLLYKSNASTVCGVDTTSLVSSCLVWLPLDESESARLRGELAAAFSTFGSEPSTFPIMMLYSSKSRVKTLPPPVVLSPLLASLWGLHGRAAAT